MKKQNQQQPDNDARVLTCLRDGHTWVRRKLDGLPKTCPRCKNPNWNIPRSVDPTDPDHWTPTQSRDIKDFLLLCEIGPPAIVEQIRRLIRAEIDIAREKCR